MDSIEKFYMDTLESVASYLESFFKGTGITISKTEVHKNNFDTEGLVFKQEGKIISPTIYVKNYLDDNLSVKEIADRIIDDVYEAFENAPDISDDIFKPEYIKENLFVTIINYDKNKDNLKTIPHEKVNDLAVVPRVKVSEGGSFIFTKDLEKHSKLTGEEVLEIAKKNTLTSDNFKLKTMREVVEDMTGTPVSEDMEDMIDNTMNIITSNDNIYGATAMLDKKFLTSVEEKLGEEFYILPSSIHELIVIPKSLAPDINTLEDMVKSVNADETLIKPQDFLSNNVYSYNSLQRKVSIASVDNNIGLVAENTITFERPRGRV